MNTTLDFEKMSMAQRLEVWRANKAQASKQTSGTHTASGNTAASRFGEVEDKRAALSSNGAGSAKTPNVLVPRAKSAPSPQLFGHLNTPQTGSRLSTPNNTSLMSPAATLMSGGNGKQQKKSIFLGTPSAIMVTAGGSASSTNSSADKKHKLMRGQFSSSPSMMMLSASTPTSTSDQQAANKLGFSYHTNPNSGEKDSSLSFMQNLFPSSSSSTVNGASEEPREDSQNADPNVMCSSSSSSNVRALSESLENINLKLSDEGNSMRFESPVAVPRTQSDSDLVPVSEATPDFGLSPSRVRRLSLIITSPAASMPVAPASGNRAASATKMDRRFSLTLPANNAASAGLDSSLSTAAKSNGFGSARKESKGQNGSLMPAATAGTSTPNTKTKARLASVTAENQRLTAKYLETMRANEVMRETLAQKQTSLAEAQNRAVMAQEEIASMSFMASVFEQRIAELENECSKDRIDHTEALSARNKKHRSEMAKLQREKQEYEDRANLMMKQMGDQMTMLQTMAMSRIETLEKELLKERRQNEEMQQENASLKLCVIKAEAKAAAALSSLSSSNTSRGKNNNAADETYETDQSDEPEQGLIDPFAGLASPNVGHAKTRKSNRRCSLSLMIAPVAKGGNRRKSNMSAVSANDSSRRKTALLPLPQIDDEDEEEEEDEGSDGDTVTDEKDGDTMDMDMDIDVDDERETEP